MRDNRVTGRALAVTAAVVTTLSGCGVLMSGVDGVRDPMTPDQSRAQVIAAAREIVAALDLPVLQVAFWSASCSDGGRPPFRGHVRISYPRAESYEQSKTQIADMIDRLTGKGWSDNPEFHSHSPALTRNRVTVVLHNQNASVVDRAIEVIGECRDWTTRNQLEAGSEWITLP